MKKIITLLLSFAISFSCLSIFSISASRNTNYVVSKASYLNLREAPTTSSGVMEYIPFGTPLYVSDIENGWAQTEYNGKEGYVSSNYLMKYSDTHNTLGSKYDTKQTVVDVSKWNGDIDWDKLKYCGVYGVIVRMAGVYYANDRTIYIDSKFVENYTDAVNAGFHVGVYFYFSAVNQSEAEKSANYIADTLEKYGFKPDMPVFLDTESTYLMKKGGSVIRNATGKALDILKKRGYYPGVYTSSSWANDYLDDETLDGSTLWVADYRGYTGYSGRYDMAQITDRAEIDGVQDSEYLDLNICYFDYPKYISDNGLNGKGSDNPTETETASEKTTAAHETDTTAEETEKSETESMTKNVDKEKYSFGDVDGNGKLSAEDARLILRFSAKLSELNKDAEKYADIDSNGSVNALDARILLRICAKLEDLEFYIDRFNKTYNFDFDY